ncbi:MAG: srp54 2 [Verrucomicrobiales bacterium]|jgi:G3E family GTPase|nr:srp54 2 [Verrucomicrobiales bacterium]
MSIQPRLPTATMPRARYIMIGGFLGAGKTTCVARMAEYFSAKGLRVGLITNDQGSALVDTTLLRSRGFATEEISGGCFCCRFNSLMEAAARLSTSNQPDLFIAEPVGSCTDLLATVSYPLRRIYGDNFLVAPLSVVVDPIRAARVLGLRPQADTRFSDKVIYIYRKQLEEADLIFVNKSDLLSESELGFLKEKLSSSFPQAEIRAGCARSGLHMTPWFDQLIAEDQRSRKVMDVDYATYAAGEALLGWLNCSVKISSPKVFDANLVMTSLANSIQVLLLAKGAEIAHLKMTLSPEDGLPELGVINLVRNDLVPELSQELSEPIDRAELILNLRAEASPETLHNAVNLALSEFLDKNLNLLARLEHIEHFRPGKPMPTHDERLTGDPKA